jgi:hypothetical protein
MLDSYYCIIYTTGGGLPHPMSESQNDGNKPIRSNKMNKKIIFFLTVGIILSIFSCGKSNLTKSTSVANISQGVVYDENSKEINIDGNVLVVHDYSRGWSLELGIVEKGNLKLNFPDLELIGIRDRLFSKIDFPYPDVKVEPQDAAWFVIVKPTYIYVFNREEEVDTGIFGGGIKNFKEADYRLEYRDSLQIFNAQFVYFTKDVIISGKGNVFGAYTFDIDIKAKKGWNVVYVKESQSGIIMQTSQKDITEVKWFAVKSSKSLEIIK